MSNQVYANGREVSCKAAGGKAICAFPDVCMTPPENPATPPGVPVPYPNTGMAKDTTKGSKTVKISNKEVMLKNKSHFKKSMGDEAGSAAKKGVITSKNRGKIYFTSWSMDVKIEGKNAVRHLDMTTHNHGSMPSNTLPWTYADRMAMAEGLKSCEDELKEVEKHCPKDKNKKVKCPEHKKVYDSNKSVAALGDYTVKIRKGKSQVTRCHRALRCILTPYSKYNKETKKEERMCCPPQTPEHLIPKSSFNGVSGYKFKDAPCMCAEGGKSDATHGLIGAARKDHMNKKGVGATWTFGEAADCGAEAANKVFPHCSKKCIRAQLKRGGHKDMKPGDTIAASQENVNKDNSALRDRLKKASS